MFLKLGLLAFVFLWGVGFQLGDWSNFTPFVARQRRLAAADSARWPVDSSARSFRSPVGGTWANLQAK